DKITASAVAIGADADLELMRPVARWGGGRAYATRDLYSIHRILAAEALIASRAYLVEERFAPQVVRTGLVDDFTVPALRGYVATAPKPASAVHLASAQDDPVLATWQFGIGRAVAFTSDATARWAAAWMPWTDAGRFWSRLVRWASRSETDDLQVTVSPQGDAATVTADAVTAEGTPLDGLGGGGSPGAGEPFGRRLLAGVCGCCARGLCGGDCRAAGAGDHPPRGCVAGGDTIACWPATNCPGD